MDLEAAAPSSRPMIKVDPHQSAKYLKQLQEFEIQYQAEQGEFNYSQETTYYLISTKFLQNWRDFCLSHQQYRQQPLLLNEDITDPNTGALLQGLKQKQDFQIVSPSVFQFFKESQGHIIRRKAIRIGNQKRVPIYLNKYKYLCINNLDLKHIDQKIKKRNEFSLKIIEQSQNSTVEAILKNISEIENYTKGYDLRLWRVDKKQSLDTLFNYLKTAADRATYQYRIKGFGKKLQTDQKIEDLQMQEGDFFVVEVKQKGRRWFLQSQNEKKCEGCYDVIELKFFCRCEKVAYCTEQCKQKDKKFHLRNCEFAQMEELNKKVQMKYTKDSMRGLVGLRNLGNTCFMNSCLQCLSNTAPLTNYFIDSLYQNQINRTNVLGTKGKLAKNYAKFIKGMWCDTDNVFSPDGIKSAVSSINPIFSGYAQHDSQEFFSFLIDGLHEDLNRIDTKPYVQSVDSKEREDRVVARQSWIAHIKRNQSIITDLMTGQYKSRVTCPTCKKESITFDPFITVTLPIPQKVTNILEGFMIFKNFETKTKRLSIPYTKPNPQQWIKAIARTVEVDEKSLSIYLVSISEGIYKAGRQSIAEIIFKLQNQNKNVFFVQQTPEEMNMKEQIEITGRFSKRGYYQASDYDNVWFKFPFFFERRQVTGLAILKRMLRFLYNEAYNDSKSRSKFFSGRSFEEYEGIMLSKRPFEIYLRYGKKLDRFYNKLEYKFQSQQKIEDNDYLSEILERNKIELKDCQLDVRFIKGALENFNFDKLKDFQDQGKRLKPSSNNSEDVTVQLSQCFDTLSQSQQLEVGNQWYCPNCKEHKLANKQMSIYKAPKILILHLKRFKQKGVIRKEKNQSKVNFPMTLDMTSYLIDPKPISSYAEELRAENVYLPPKYTGNYKITCSQAPIYQLYAVSNHYGGLGGGHYTAFAKNGDKWYDFNDSSVRTTSQSNICGSGAYILFYKRKD